MTAFDPLRLAVLASQALVVIGWVLTSVVVALRCRRSIAANRGDWRSYAYLAVAFCLAGVVAPLALVLRDDYLNLILCVPLLLLLFWPAVLVERIGRRSR